MWQVCGGLIPRHPFRHDRVARRWRGRGVGGTPAFPGARAYRPLFVRRHGHEGDSTATTAQMSRGPCPL